MMESGSYDALITRSNASLRLSRSNSLLMSERFFSEFRFSTVDTSLLSSHESHRASKEDEAIGLLSELERTGEQSRICVAFG